MNARVGDVFTAQDLKERLQILNEIRAQTCTAIQQAYDPELAEEISKLFNERGKNIESVMAISIQLILHGVMAEGPDDHNMTEKEVAMTRRLIIDSVVAMIEQESEARIKGVGPDGKHVN